MVSVNRLLSGGSPKPWFKKKRFVIPLSFFVVAIIAGALGGTKSSTSSTSVSAAATASTDSSGARVYPASVDGYAVVDPATIAVRFTVHNDGTQAVSPACTISLQNAGGSYHGFDVFYMNPISAGGVTHGTGNITITSQGAQFVTQSSISCTANTYDKAVSTGTGVTVVSVTDALGAYDASSGWYWGGIIKVSGVSGSTQLKCTETATDATGKVIATHSFNAVTFNDGTLTGYGEGQDPTVDATQAIAQAIKNVTATCSLN
jgi:hypothetical protein